jgi:pyridoxal phosphate enzyme (YggS family)
MAVNTAAYFTLMQELKQKNVTLVAVSKTKPVEDILALYRLGHRDFGENYVQELTEKQAQLPKDIRWHFIGHLQRNKVKYIAPFIHLIHSVDSLKLLLEIGREGVKQQRILHCLLQVHIAQEESKFGLDETALSVTMETLSREKPAGIAVDGLMGMASFTSDSGKVRQEFRQLKNLFDKYKHTAGTGFTQLSMGMSGDYPIAIEEGSNMVRIGSILFGERN